MKKIYISLIDYHGLENTKSCLDSMDTLVVPSGFSLHVCIINNVPHTTLLLNLKKYKTFSLEIINNKVNSGFSGGHNVGISTALKNNADYVVILNNDTYVESNLIKELVSVMEGDAKIGIAVPKIYFASGFEFHKDRYKKEEKGKVFWYAGGIIDWENMYQSHRGVDEVDIGQYDVRQSTDFATGCCMMISKSVLQKIKGFDERYFLYQEDVDLNMRVKQAGYSVVYVPTAVMWHKNAGSTGGSGSKLQDYFTTRNRLLFANTYASLRTRFALFRESMKMLLQGREWQKKGVIDFYLRKFGKGTYTV